MATWYAVNVRARDGSGVGECVAVEAPNGSKAVEIAKRNGERPDFRLVHAYQMYPEAIGLCDRSYPEAGQCPTSD